MNNSPDPMTDPESGFGPAKHLRRVIAIVNPRTRRPLEVVRAALDRACPPGVAVVLLVSRSPGEAGELARQHAASCDLMVAAGGDGTVSDVASGIIGTGLPLAILPAGSTNIVAQELGIPSDLDAAARLIFGRHRIVRRDAGRCGDRLFLHMAGAGFDAHFFERSDPALKRRVGWLAYLPAAASAIGETPARYCVRVDGETIEETSPLVVIANGGSVIRPELRIAPEIRADDGLLDVLVFRGSQPAAVARAIGRFVAGRLADSPDVVWRRGTTIDISSDPVMPIQLDGDVATHTPARFEIMPLALELVAPPDRS
jgi:diacylglycerol kinase (ATP)